MVVTAVLFTAYHRALDPFFAVDLLLFGAATALVTWRTGGLEVAVVMHAVGNMAMELPELLGYRAPDDSPLGFLVGYVPTLVTLAVVFLVTRRRGTVRVPVADVLPTTDRAFARPHERHGARAAREVASGERPHHPRS